MSLPTWGCTVSATGISAPSYAEIYADAQARYQGIFGSDAIISPDSQDGQLLAIFCKAISDANDATIAAYNSFRPAGAVGAGLSSIVKINGIVRNAASNSSVDIYIVGEVGITINDGIVGDTAGNKWLLPSAVTIPPAGFITVTATCSEEGAVTADVNAVNQILTPTRGWQSATNPSAASAGDPVETDAELRQRQTTSTALPALTVLDGIIGAIANLAGVNEVKGYENDTGAPDANGLPAHSISMVVDGGDAVEIAQTILLKKAPGAATYGTTSEVVDDPIGIPYTINFYRPTLKRIVVLIDVDALTGYSTAIEDGIKAAVAAYINALLIGADVSIAKLYLPAQLYGGPGSETFDLNSILISIYPASPGSSDIVIAFNERAACAVADITITT